MAASRTSSTSLATCSDPVSTIEASSRSSMEVAVTASRLAAPTTAFSWFRSWCPKSASSSASIANACEVITGLPAVMSWFFVMASMRPIHRRLGGRLEHGAGELHAVGAEMLKKSRLGPCGRVVTERGAVRGHPQLRVHEELLHRDLTVLHPCHLGAADHLARSATKTLGLNDDVHRRCDLAADGAGWQLSAGQQDQGLEAAKRIARVVGVQSAHRAVGPGVHRLQHVECLSASTLPQHDPVGPHPKAVANQAREG